MKIFPNKFKPIQKINNELYLVSAEISVSEVRDIQDIKNYLGCHIAFKNNKTDTYIFCEHIQDVPYEQI